MRRILLILVCCLGVSACSSAPKNSALLSFDTASPVWFDQLDGQYLGPLKGRGMLVLPSAGGAPYPAVILLHTSMGLGMSEWAMAGRLNGEGMAVFAVDSFTPRKIHKIIEDQTKVSEVTILHDLYAAYNRLKDDPRIDNKRIAVVGFSKGGISALYSSFKTVNGYFGYDSSPFAAHVAYYPWCGLGFHDMGISAPVQIHIGGRDSVTPPELCRALVDGVKAQNAQADIEAFIYKGARHAFNHPVLKYFPPLGVDYNIPRHCRIIQDADGVFVEAYNEMPVDSQSYASAITGCSAKGAWVSGDEGVALRAENTTVEFLKENLR